MAAQRRVDRGERALRLLTQEISTSSLENENRTGRVRSCTSTPTPTSARTDQRKAKPTRAVGEKKKSTWLLFCRPA